MALFFVVISGPREGDRFKAREGLTLGRSKADINLRDPKASGHHAYIKQDGARLYLMDNGSTNGIKVNGRRVDELQIEAGIKFTIGTTEIEVVAEAEKKDEEASLEEWRRTALRIASRAQGISNALAPELKPFPSPVELRFGEGPLAQSRIYAYGPRLVDAFSLDLDVDVPSDPGFYFELIPEGESAVRFRTPHPEFVRLNGTPTDADVLKDGDIIEIQDVSIKVLMK